VTIVDDFWAWYDQIWGKRGHITNFVQTVKAMNTEEIVESYWKDQTDDTRADPGAISAYNAAKNRVAGNHSGMNNPLYPLMLTLLDDWKGKVAKYDMSDPKDADKKLAGLAADVMAMSASAGLVELFCGAFPDGEGTVASAKVSQMMAWIGAGAVVTAVAHDPVKIGLLRPYQDLLEAQFRNRRPEERMLLLAYSKQKISKAKYDNEIAKWGYSQEFTDIMAESSYRGLTFSNLMSIAKQGLLDRNMAVASLQQYGMKQLYIDAAVTVLMNANQQATDKAQAAALTASNGAPLKEKDLTVSQIQSAYQNLLMDRGAAQNMILALGYSMDEAKILLDLAELRRKLPSAATLKKLTLAEYVKA
jgi:hypothetical protein